jgi:hypothetical protein
MIFKIWGSVVRSDIVNMGWLPHGTAAYLSNYLVYMTWFSEIKE